MKVCYSCGAECENSCEKCPECSSDFLLYKCSNCSEVFDSSFCPKCGVEAGNDGKLCPQCGKRYYGKSCPDCGYRELAPGAAKTYVPVKKDNQAQEGEPEKYDLSGKGYSAQELMLAEMALNKKSGGGPDLSFFMPKKSRCKKSTALILCLLFGVFGAHQFYVGNSRKGMLYSLTAGLVYVGVIMDAIAIARGDFTDSKGLPLS